jgi:hypothetical protein
MPPSPHFQLGAHWVYEESLQFSTSFENDGMLVVNIQELQQTSTPPLALIKSFPALPCGKFSFSPMSFYASFVTKMEVIILDIEDSRILLQAKATHSPYTQPGCFSPGGCFFAYGIQEYKIHIWKNTSANYVPWSNL